MRHLVLALLLSAVAAAPASAAAPPPEMPPATYKTVSQEVLVPMDDGVRLAATVTFPSSDGSAAAPGKFPVVVEMTPYGRNAVCGCMPGTDLASRGIIGAVVDTRGTGGSEGSLKDNYFSPREQRDGYQLVEYFGTRPYSSGRVGMAGGSYLGITQYLAAEQQPPHLSVITPIVALSDLYREGYTHDGIPNFFFDSQYLGVQQPASYTGPNQDPTLWQEMLQAKAGQVSGSATLAFDYLSRPNDDQWYRDRSPLYNADKIKVPVLIYDGWHDGFIFGGNVMYRELSKRRDVETQLVIDPCTHKGCGAPFDPEKDASDIPDSEAVVFEFLRKYLLPGSDVPQRPRARIYMQGKNAWVDSPSWPPPTAGPRPLYLSSAGLGDAKPGSESTQSYPTNPAGGLNMALDQYGTVAASPYVPTDQRLDSTAGLTWRTPALKAPMSLTGSGTFHLVASSSATNTDWIAKLSDVAPDGSETIITSGYLRASFRELDKQRTTPELPWHSDTNPTPIEAGKYYDYDIAIWPTGYELAAGHQLQLRLSSYDFPTHLPGTIVASLDDPASTTFVPLSPATNTVRLGGSDPSYLSMTVLGAAPPPQVAGVKKSKPKPAKKHHRAKRRQRSKCKKHNASHRQGCRKGTRGTHGSRRRP